MRFRKSIKLSKGGRVHIGKKEAGIRFGTKGSRSTLHAGGRKTLTVGVPGTGVHFASSSGRERRTPSSYAVSRTSIEKHAARLQRMVERKRNAVLVEEYRRLIERLTGVHKQSDDVIDWRRIHEEGEPFSPQGIGPREAKAVAAYENYRPGFLAKLIKPLGERKRRRLEQAVEAARRQDEREYEEWKRRHQLSGRILQGDTDAYLEVIEEMKPLDDLLEFGAEFAFGTDRPSAMEIEFRVKSAELIPDYSLSLTKTGKLSKKELTKTAYYALVQDYVCSTAIRIARDLFALLPVRHVVVHAVDRMRNPETGYDEEATILSVLFSRDGLNGLNLERIDPSEAMNQFPHRMRFSRTGGFQPVDRIVPD